MMSRVGERGEYSQWGRGASAHSESMVPPLPAGEAKRLWLEGTAEFRQRSLHNARACFDRALAVDPGSPWLLSNRSAVLLSLECIDAALRDAEKCITLSPQWSKGFIRAAMVMRHVGRYPDALQYLQKGLEGNANDPELQTLLSCTTTEDLFEAALARVSACDSPPRSSQSPPARGGRRPSASTARSDGGATPPRLRAADADSASPARRASLSAQQGLTPPRRPAATPFSGLSPLPSSPGARRIVREDGTSFHTFFTSPLPHSGRSALNAFPTPADSRCRTASPPGVVVSQEGYTPRLSAGRLAAAACAFAVPGVVFALVVGDQLAWDGGGGWPDACGFDVGAAWVLLLACAAAWGIALGGVVPAPPAKQPARFSTAASVVLPLLVLATAVVGGLLATGSHGFSSVILASEDEKTRFSTTLVEEFDAVLGTLNAHTDEPQLRDALRTLKKLQEHLVFLPVDKTSHDFGFICKEKYKELLRDELQQSSTYQEVGESIDDVLERHRDFNKSHKFVHTDNLPYLYGIPKLHKPEPRMRYIAGVSEKGNVEKKDEQKDRDEKGRDKKRMKTRASTTPAHQEASGLLKLVLATLRSKDEATFLQTGIRRFFVVESVDDVAVHIKTNYARLRKKAPRTFDFKEMYTKIPQKQIVDYVMSAVAEAFEYMKSEKGANVEAQRAKHRFEFGKPDESNTTSYNVEEIRALVSFIVGNTFVTNGGTCYQQVSGIPMGGNASPDLANLYCYWCEKQYIDGLVAKGLQEEARNHADSVRFIDDFLTWGVRPPPEDIYGMEYGETSKGVDDVVFLGMRIRMERNDKTDFIRMSVLDKGEEFPWNPIKYTHVESTVPRNTGTSIFKGALIRAARICNNMPDLKVEVMKVYYRLRNRGFSGRELRRTFDTFVAQTYGKYELDARVLSRFYHFVGKAYDEGRPTNEEKSYISIRTPQPPDGSPKHPPGRTSPQSTSPHKSEPTSTTHPATKPTNPPGRNGITNIRNSCFFAASVQFLARRTSFRLQLANLTHLDTNQQMVQRLFTDFDAGQNIHGTMATLRSLVFNTTADDSAHRDVHELLTWIRSCVTGDDDDQATEPWND
ncbi:Protein STIP1-like protein [Diplonema papillatum]|nr:Protein STIP1-like protein [Diplonema papillatum]